MTFRGRALSYENDSQRYSTATPSATQHRTLNLQTKTTQSGYLDLSLTTSAKNSSQFLKLQPQPQVAINTTSSSVGSLLPSRDYKTLALLRETHMDDSAIKVAPPTNKQGIFEKEAPLQADTNAFNSSQTSMLGGQPHKVLIMKLPEINESTIAAQSRSVLKTCGSGIPTVPMTHGQSAESSKLSTHRAAGRQQQALLERSIDKQKGLVGNNSLSPQRLFGIGEEAAAQIIARPLLTSTDSLIEESKLSKNQQYVASLQEDLKGLIKMEPYAHRIKQNQSKATYLGSGSDAVRSGSVGGSEETSTAVTPGETGTENMRRTVPKLTNQQIEKWLNETLQFQLDQTEEEQARLMNLEDHIAAQLPKNKTKSPLIALELDRIALDKAGVDQKDVNRLYRALYANSVAVYDILRDAMVNVGQSERYQLMGRFWTAFEMVLQSCCPTDFKMIGQKLVEDQIAEINTVKKEYMIYKEKLDAQQKKLTHELALSKSLLEEAQDDRDRQLFKRQELERKTITMQQKHEDEIRLRIDFELKINKLHNLNVALRNHDTTLNRKIETLEADLKEFRIRCHHQQEEIVSLRASKRKQDQIKQLDDVKIDTVEKLKMETKEKLVTVTMSMQQRETELAKKTNVNLQLQTVLDNRESRIRALQDVIETTKTKDAEVTAQYQNYHKQIKMQQASIQEYMRGLDEQDAKLTDAQRDLTDTQFNAFEFQMAQSRVIELENQLDKLLEDTTEQRQKIEDFVEEVADLMTQIENLQKSDSEKKQRITGLVGIKSALKSEVNRLSSKGISLEQRVKELTEEAEQKSARIQQLETDKYRLQVRQDELNTQVEQAMAREAQAENLKELAKQSASMWEDKYHKTSISLDNSQKLLQQKKIEAMNMGEAHQESEKFLLEHQEELVKKNLELSQTIKAAMDNQRVYRRRCMRLCIYQRLTGWFLNVIIPMVVRTQKTHDDELKVIANRNQMQMEDFESHLLEKNLVLDQQSMAQEDLRSHAMRLIDEKTTILEQIAVQKSLFASHNEIVQGLQDQVDQGNSQIAELERKLAAVKEGRKEAQDKVDQFVERHSTAEKALKAQNESLKKEISDLQQSSEFSFKGVGQEVACQTDNYKPSLCEAEVQTDQELVQTTVDLSSAVVAKPNMISFEPSVTETQNRNVLTTEVEMAVDLNSVDHAPTSGNKQGSSKTHDRASSSGNAHLSSSLGQVASSQEQSVPSAARQVYHKSSTTVHKAALEQTGAPEFIKQESSHNAHDSFVFKKPIYQDLIGGADPAIEVFPQDQAYYHTQTHWRQNAALRKQPGSTKGRKKMESSSSAERNASPSLPSSAKSIVLRKEARQPHSIQSSETVGAQESSLQQFEGDARSRLHESSEAQSVVQGKKPSRISVFQNLSPQAQRQTSSQRSQKHLMSQFAKGEAMHSSSDYFPPPLEEEKSSNPSARQQLHNYQHRSMSQSPAIRLKSSGKSIQQSKKVDPAAIKGLLRSAMNRKY